MKVTNISLIIGLISRSSLQWLVRNEKRFSGGYTQFKANLLARKTSKLGVDFVQFTLHLIAFRLYF